MNDEDVTKIAERVSALMQLDRMRHRVDTELDMTVLANVPDYIARVFETANAADPNLEPRAYYDLINKRISQVQAQLYLIRLELENRHARDPSRIYADPMEIATYGERMETVASRPRTLDFGSDILGYGWFPVEQGDPGFFRWMRVGDISVACVPHLGVQDQRIVIHGYVMHAEQLNTLTIRAAGTEARIASDGNKTGACRFTATLDLTANAVKSASHVPIEFRMTDFRQPNDLDSRLLGANISTFECRPRHGDGRSGADRASSAS